MNIIGPDVPEVNPGGKIFPDDGPELWPVEQTFNANLRHRTRKLRKAKGWTTEQMARALGIPPERYRKYESRTPMPQYLIPVFAAITGTDVAYILTGKSAIPPDDGIRN